ncbi:MAG: diguanylate cyclase [Steroidobacteraceae bacterium]
MLERPVPRSTRLSGLYVALAVAGFYFVADNLLNKVALGDGWQIFWPLNGVTIALLIMRPRTDWPALLGAVALGTGAGEFVDNNPLDSTIVQRCLSVLEVALSASVLPRFKDLESWLRSPRLYPRFAAAVIVGPAVSGLLAAAYFHSVDAKPFAAAFNCWAIADAMGVAAVLPLVLALRSTQTGTLRSSNRWLVTVGTLAVAVGVMTLIFSTSQYPLIFVLYPLLMLVDWLLGLFGSSIALCCACIMAVFLTEHGYGPFANTAALGVSRDLAVQLYLGFHLMGFLPISILFLEQRRMHKELREALARTAVLASIDGLTNLANRRTLDAHLEEQWRLATHTQTSLALLMVDADHFKEFNDRFGHQAGDECLRAIAMTLRTLVTRPDDVVARFGGEEFAILLPGTPLEGAQHVGEAIRAAIADSPIVHPKSAQLINDASTSEARHVTVSVGCAALVPPADMQFHDLVELADQALYLAKRGGRNRVCVAGIGAGAWSPGAAARKLRARIEGIRLQRQSRGLRHR